MNKIDLSEKELQVLKLYLDQDNLNYVTLFKVDNEKIHNCIFFNASVFLSQDKDEVYILGSREDIDKILYYVGGEANTPDVVFEDMYIFSSEDLYCRFEGKLDSDDEYRFE